MFYPGHIGSHVDQQSEALAQVDHLLGETSRLWAKHGLRMEIVSGGSTPPSPTRRRSTSG